MISEAQRLAIVSGTAKATPFKALGLRGRGELFLLDNACVRYITRSSRFLRKDAEAFVMALEAASRFAGKALPGYVLVARAPVCSKARAWLENQGVVVETLGT